MSQWKYGEYIKTGIVHERYGMPCQDSVYELEDENCAVAALCDGIGSLPHSGRAGRIASMAACHILKKCGGIDFYRHAEAPDGMIKDLLERIDAYISYKFNEKHIDRTQGDSTLAFVFVSKKFGFVFAGCLGDSAVCLIKKSGNVCLTENNPNIESTASVGMREPWKYCKTALLRLNSDDFLGAILTSDGMDGEIYAKNTSQVYQNAAYYFNCAQKGNFRDTIAARVEPMVRRSGSCFDDDISVAVISRAQGAVAFPKDSTWLCCCGERNRLDDTYCNGCGRDFLDVYRNAPFERFGGKTQFFRYANSHPDFERKAVLPAQNPNGGGSNSSPFSETEQAHAEVQSAENRPEAPDERFENNYDWEKIAAAGCLADGEVSCGRGVLNGTGGNPDRGMEWWQKVSLLVAGATTIAVGITVVALHRKGGKS